MLFTKCTKLKYLFTTLMLLMLVSFKPTLSHAKGLFNKEAQDSTNKVTFAGVPIVNYNTTLGLMLGGMGTMFYQLNPNDTISPSSSSMVIGLYSTSKTFMGLAIQKMYYNEDKWRTTAVIGAGDIYYQFFQNIPGLGAGIVSQDGIWIDFNTSMYFVYANQQRMVFNDFYVGIQGTANWATTIFDINNPITGEKLSSSANMISLGYNFAYDNRDDVNYPTKGWFGNYANDFNRTELGSSNNYTKFETSLNYFWDIHKNTKSILVSRIYTNITTGDVPFQAQNFIGRDDLRGYSQGKYRGNQVYALQAELRQKVYKKFGMVGFLGLGSAVNAISEIPNKDILPSVGVGVRYLMIAKENINIGMDVGLGKDDWSLTFRIGEAFSR